MLKMVAIRDAFFDRLYEIAKKNRQVILLSDDFGAPSLDKFREDLTSQYINIGIAEQNMVSVATVASHLRKLREASSNILRCRYPSDG